jgi:hypothetical protein
MLKKLFTKTGLVRNLLAIATVVVIFLVVPRSDHQSFSYELNQPWKYPLLTAPFDMPILRDSASISALRDSIDRSFVPFVKKDDAVGASNVDKFAKSIGKEVSSYQLQVLTSLLAAVYNRGIVDADTYNHIVSSDNKTLRSSERQGDMNTAVNIDASQMLSPAKAFEYIDSVYHHSTYYLGDTQSNETVSRALNVCLLPNVVVDTVADRKFREQEYLNVTAAYGIIKQGQRIVDKGEIITSQIYTNLNTYQEMLEEREDTNRPNTYFAIGQALYLAMCVAMLYLFLAIFRRTFYDNLQRMTFLMIFITLFVLFAIVMFENIVNGIYLVPFAAVPVIILIFFDSRTAIFALLTTVLMSATVATFPFQFVIMELTVGLVATFSIHQLSRRSQLLKVALVSFMTYCFTYFVLSLLLDGNLDAFTWKILAVFGINAVILSFAYILIFVIEKLFGFVSTVTLVELSDINNPLLLRLAEEAPGTFQHSMQVSTLAAEAARAVGANTQLVRTGALYHDIGKMESPIFFTENQHGINPHAGLDPETSARKIISHVTTGLNMAAREKLPQSIRDFITEHHGRGITKYFYNTAVNENPDKEIDKERFRYPGPNPQSKETAILMMADSVEAASRSLKDFSSESINALVDKIVDGQKKEGLFNESPLSFKDVEVVKNTFKKRLSTIYHSRIVYPELHNSENEEDAAAESK